MKNLARNPQTLLIMAGGTGGHVFPALAVGELLRSQGWTVTWMGTERGIESRLAPSHNFPIDFITIAGVRGKRKVDWLWAPLKVLRACWQAWQILLRRRPAVVLGMGGFAAGPGALAAWLGNFPLLIHEQNSIPGMTNRFLAKLASQVCISFEGALSGPRVHLTGNPVRADLCNVPEPSVRYAQRQAPLHVLVLGGSLGAKAINELMPQILAALPAEERPLVRHQTGDKHFQETKQLYEDAQLEVELVPFIEDMKSAYLWADYVICRAGAMTIAELTTIGLPAILVPYPHAVDDHQTTNARLMVDVGAAVLVPQSELTLNTLREGMKQFGSLARCEQAATAARAVAKPNAAEAVALLCQELARDR